MAFDNANVAPGSNIQNPIFRSDFPIRFSNPIFNGKKASGNPGSVFSLQPLQNCQQFWDLRESGPYAHDRTPHKFFVLCFFIKSPTWPYQWYIYIYIVKWIWNYFAKPCIHKHYQYFKEISSYTSVLVLKNRPVGAMLQIIGINK